MRPALKRLPKRCCARDLSQAGRHSVIEYYPEIRLLHIGSVIASGSLFLVRGILAQTGRRAWALAAGPRYLSYAVDTTLLAAALMLLAVLPSAAYANGWLLAKLALLPLFIALGWLALRSEAGPRLGYLAGALLAYAGMFLIARAHDPLGPFRSWPGG